MPFVKGQSGNPRGRPKRGAALSDILRYKLAQPLDADARRTQAELWAERFIQQAMDGDTTASRTLLERLDGAVVQKQEHTGKDGGPLVVALSWPEQPHADA